MDLSNGYSKFGLAMEKTAWLLSEIKQKTKEESEKRRKNFLAVKIW